MNNDSIENNMGNSLVVQWLGLHASTAGGTGSIPGRGTRIPHATVKKKKYVLIGLQNYSA